MGERESHVVELYSRHPISGAHVLAKLRERRGTLDAVRPEELYPHDQDHYGGLEANDGLAGLAGMGRGIRVADFCAGLGGPARYWAQRFDLEVTGIELNPERVRGAAALTRLVGLEDRVCVVAGNVLAVPLADRAVDAVVSQEALLHVPDKMGALAEAFRVLKPSGRLAFTDWVLHRPLAARDEEILWRGLAAQSLLHTTAYREILEHCGFRILSVEDLTQPWGDILQQRFAMYRKLRAETERAGTPAGDDAFYESYARLVACVQAGTLGGGRFAAEKPVP